MTRRETKRIWKLPHRRKPHTYPTTDGACASVSLVSLPSTLQTQRQSFCLSVSISTDRISCLSQDIQRRRQLGIDVPPERFSAVAILFAVVDPPPFFVESLGQLACLCQRWSVGFCVLRLKVACVWLTCQRKRTLANAQACEHAQAQVHAHAYAHAQPTHHTSTPHKHKTPHRPHSPHTNTTHHHLLNSSTRSPTSRHLTARPPPQQKRDAAPTGSHSSSTTARWRLLSATRSGASRPRDPTPSCSLLAWQAQWPATRRWVLCEIERQKKQTARDRRRRRRGLERMWGMEPVGWGLHCAW